MAERYIVLTDSGIEVKNQSLLTTAYVSSGSQFHLGDFMPDSKEPRIWALDVSAKLVRQFNPASNSFDLQFSVQRGVRSVRTDAVTGSCYALQPISGASQNAPRLTRWNNIAYVSETISLSGLGSRGLVMPLDMVIDASRRLLWITDSGNNRIIKADIDSLEVINTYEHGSMVCPFGLAIDESTGRAYVRAYIGHQEGNSSSSSISKSSSSSTYSESFRDLMVIIGDEIENLIELPTSPIVVDDRLFNPTPSDLKQLWDSNLPLFVPSAASMDFDHFRRRLWWVSAAARPMLYMMDVVNGSVSCRDLSSEVLGIHGLKVDLSDGSAVLACQKGLNGVVLRVDKSNFAVMTRGQTIFVARDIALECGRNELISFHWEAVEPYVEDEESSGSSSYSTELHPLAEFSPEFLREDVEADAYIEEGQPSPLRSVPARIWVNDPSGVDEVKVGTIKRMPTDSFMDATSAVMLPVFSWTSKAAVLHPVFLGITADGNIERVIIDEAISSRSDRVLDVHITNISVPSNISYIYASGGSDRFERVCYWPSDQEPNESEQTPMLSTSSSSQDAQRLTSIVSASSNLMLDLKVAWNSRDGSAWCLDEHAGEVVQVLNVMTNPSPVRYGTAPSPFKLVWSDQNGFFLVGSISGIFSVSQANKRLIPQYGLNGHVLRDFSTDESGRVAMACTKTTAVSSVFRVLDKDLKKVILSRRSNAPITACLSGGNLICAEESENSTVSSDVDLSSVDSSVISEAITGTVFSYVDLSSGNSSGISEIVPGTPRFMGKDISTDHVWSVMSTGDILRLSPPESEIVGWEPEIKGSFASAVLAAVPAGYFPKASVDAQDAIRVYVGSSPGANDRWDSGDVETALTRVVYGGGDNLEPGHSYWVQIAVRHGASGWSEFQSKKFTVPIT